MSSTSETRVYLNRLLFLCTMLVKYGMRDKREFLSESLRAPQFDTKVIREVSKARNGQVSRKLAALQTRRVKVTDSRMNVTLVFVYHFHTSVVDGDFLQMSPVP